jgi:Domain of unknown function (DUF4936)
MARELFVYWKVARAEADAACAAAAALLQALRQAHPELDARLMRRAEEAGDKATFMETYRALPAGVTPALQAAIEERARLSFAALGHPARHVEVFESLHA